MSELHILQSTKDYAKLLERRVRGRSVLELGCGTGVLTRLLLDAGAESIRGYEILPNVCLIKDERFALVTGDYTDPKVGLWDDLSKHALDVCLVANPAYSTLPFIVEKVLPYTEDAIVMVPSRCVEQFKGLGFEEAILFEPTEFDPIAAGLHHLMVRGFEEAPVGEFVDLHYQVGQLKTDTIPERIEELASRLPSVAICAVGGFPVITTPREGPRWCGKRITSETLRQHFLDALGLSAVLTYSNMRGHSLEKLGRICVDRNEAWAYHWATATLVFAGHSPAVHLAFARDTRFQLGWAIEKEYSGRLFGVWTASASIKDWLKFTSKKDDLSFDLRTRDAMAQAYTLLKGILP